MGRSGPPRYRGDADRYPTHTPDTHPLRRADDPAHGTVDHRARAGVAPHDQQHRLLPSERPRRDHARRLWDGIDLPHHFSSGNSWYRGRQKGMAGGLFVTAQQVANAIGLAALATIAPTVTNAHPGSLVSR